MKKNTTISLRIETELNSEIKEASNGMDIKPAELLRFCIRHSLNYLRSEKLKAKGWKKLNINYSLS